MIASPLGTMPVELVSSSHEKFPQRLKEMAELTSCVVLEVSEKHFIVNWMEVENLNVQIVKR